MSNSFTFIGNNENGYVSPIWPHDPEHKTINKNIKVYKLIDNNEDGQIKDLYISGEFEANHDEFYDEEPDI